MRALALLALVLLVGCQESEHCPPPGHPAGALVRLGVANGGERSSTPIPYFSSVATDHGIVSITPLGASSTPVARVDPVPTRPASPLTNAGTTLLGPGPSPWRLPGAAGTHLVTVAATAVVLGADAQLRGVSLRSGRPLWNARLDHQLLTRHLVVAGGVVLATGESTTESFSDRRDRAYALDARTGRLLWVRVVVPVTHRVDALMVVGRTVVLGVSAERPKGHGQVRALDPRTGRPRWTTTLQRAAVRSVGVSGGQLVIATSDVVLFCG